MAVPGRFEFGPERDYGQYRRRLDSPGRCQLALKSNIQLTESSLLPLEKFALGGIDTVRGYRENSLVRDNGWSLSLELQYGLNGGGHGWKLVPFLDYGRAWNQSGPLSRAEDRASAGLGVLWSGSKGLAAELWLAQGLLGLDSPGHSLQDQGIHFQVSYHAL